MRTENHFAFADKRIQRVRLCRSGGGGGGLKLCCFLAIHKCDTKDKLWEFPTVSLNESRATPATG